MPYCEYSSPVGELTLTASTRGLTGVWWPDDPRRPGLTDRDPGFGVLREAGR